MPFCGRPSQACEACRIKRAKCDQKRPGCSQCKRAKRKCPGYRDATDVIFRDESMKVVAKFKQRSQKQQDNSINASLLSLKEVSFDDRKTFSQHAAEHSDTLTIFTPIVLPAESVAIDFLFCHYLVDSHFTYLPALYQSTTRREKLNPILRAVGFAGLALQSNAESLSWQAHTSYTKAVSQIKANLLDPESSLEDEMVAAVLLMALYETLTLREAARPETWEMHARGAVSLLKLRGPAQFQTEIGVQLFIHAATLIRFVGIQRGERLSHELSALMNHHSAADAFLVASLIPSRTSTPIKPFSSSMEKFADLWADLEQEVLIEPHEIILRADDLLHTISVHANLLDITGWGFVDDAIDRKEDYFNQPQECKKWSPGLAQVWNNINLARLMLNNLICEKIPLLSLRALVQLHPRFRDDDDITAQYEEGAVKAAQDIYDMSLRFFPDAASTIPVREPPKVAAGYFLIWPLFLIGCQENTAARFKDKSISKLNQIADTLCLPHAKKAADVLAGGARTENWMHTFHVF